MWLLFSIISSLFLIGIGSQGGVFFLPTFFSFSWIYFITFPIFYGIGGLVIGFIFTPMINLLLKIIKGLDLDLEMYEEHKAYQPPASY